MQGRSANQGPTFGQLLNKYTKAVQQEWPLKKRPRSPPRQGTVASPRRDYNRRRGDFPPFPPQKVYATMPWAPPTSNATNPVWEHEGIWMQCFPMPHPPPYQREERSRTPVHDRLGSHQSGLAQQATPVRPVGHDRSDRSHQRPAQRVPPRFEYRVKEKRPEVQHVVETVKASRPLIRVLVINDNGLWINDFI